MPMRTKIDLTGQKFGRWTVIKEGGRLPAGSVLWKCRCVCGTEREVRSYALLQGTSLSCGCYARDYQRERLIREDWTGVLHSGVSRVIVEVNGEKKTIAEWAKVYKDVVAYSAIINRYRRGWRGPDLFLPTMKTLKAKYEYPDPQFDINKHPDEQLPLNKNEPGASRRRRKPGIAKASRNPALQEQVESDS